MKFAIAVFVKTPDKSPLKTRLASTIGKGKAESFYKMSLKAIVKTLQETKAKAYWAVTEKDSLDAEIWNDFETIHSGDGDLGGRQSLIYDTLIQKYDKVLLIGADSPQISVDLINQAISALDRYDFVIGPSGDGGYYLFGGKKNISKTVWEDIPWSHKKTKETLVNKLSSKPYFLKTLNDVDFEKDLYNLQFEMPENMNQKQIEIINWIKNLDK